MYIFHRVPDRFPILKKCGKIEAINIGKQWVFSCNEWWLGVWVPRRDGRDQLQASPRAKHTHHSHYIHVDINYYSCTNMS